MNRARLFPIAALCGLPISAALAQPCGTPWAAGPATGPAARTNFSMAYDSARGRIVLFGGYSGPNLTGDTWEWAASGPSGSGSWSFMPVSGPSGRSDFGLAYDALRHKTVLFGGLDNQTWEWDGVAWTHVTPIASPPAMHATLMAYDASRQRTVLVSTILNGPGSVTTWEYDGTTWSQSPDITPMADWYEFAIGYDGARSRMVLVGSMYQPYTGLAGTWEREAGGWTLKATGTLLTYPTVHPGLAFDSNLNRVVFIDGSERYNQTGIWAWDGAATRWTWKTSAGPARGTRPAAFDIAGNQLVLFGGQIESGGQLGETWLFNSQVRSGPELTDTGQRSTELPLDGPTGTLNVAAIGSGTITYRWRLNGVELSDGGAFSGTGTPQLTIDPNDIVLTGYYDTVVTDSCGQNIRPPTFVNIRCYANCDNSSAVPRLNAEDFQCFLNSYASATSLPIAQQITSYGNCDHSSVAPVLNANDFQCFLNAYAKGCQ